MDEFEDTLMPTICGQSLTEDGTEEELTVQLEFVSAIRFQDTCAMELLNLDMAKLRSI